MNTPSYLRSAPCILFTILLAGFLSGCRPLPPEAPAYDFVTEWGERGTDPGQLREPVGIAVSDGEVFVSDTGNSRIQVFDLSGQFLRQFGAEEMTGEALGRPMHLDVRGDTVYVPDYLNDRIRTFSLSGQEISSIGLYGTEPGQFDAPSSAAVDESGRIHVADFYNQRIQILAPDGEPIGQLGTTGQDSREPGQFTYPTDVALFSDGGFVVADAYNHRVQAFGADGAFKWRVPEDISWADSTQGRFNVATSVAVGPDGNVYVVDFYNHRIQILSETGRFLSAFGSQGSGPGQFDYPGDISFDADGNIYVLDFGNERIQKFAPTKGGAENRTQ